MFNKIKQNAENPGVEASQQPVVDLPPVEVVKDPAPLDLAKSATEDAMKKTAEEAAALASYPPVVPDPGHPHPVFPSVLKR